MPTIYPAVIEPQTYCQLCKVPMDGSYNDVYIATSAAGYEGWVKGKAVLDAETDFSYQRVDAVIRYPANCEDIFNSGANYVMWKNENYNGKTFYAYITGLEYRNPNLTYIHIDVDVVGTFIYDVFIGSQFVKRMTTRTDELYQYLEEESVSVSPEMYVYNERESRGEKFFSVRSTALIMKMVDNPFTSPQVGLIEGMAMPQKMYFVGEGNKATLQEVLDTVKWEFSEILDSYSVPAMFVDIGDLMANNGDASSVIQSDESSIRNTVGSTFKSVKYNGASYKPRNKKLYAFPYTAFEVTNGSNSSMLYAFEGFVGYTPTFKLYSSLLPPVSVSIKAVNYMGSGELSENGSLKLMDFPRTGISEKGAGDALVGAVLGGIATVATGGAAVGAALAGASNLVKAGTEAEDSRMVEAFGAQGWERRQSELNASASYHSEKGQNQKSFAGKALNLSKASLVSSAGAMLNYINSALSAGRRVGSGPSASMSISALNEDLIGLVYSRKTIPAEMAKVVDDYFSCYGYSIGRVMNLNVLNHVRSKFDYYQTEGCTIRGAMPIEYSIKLSALFDNGIRFWYTDDIGDLSTAILDANVV